MRGTRDYSKGKIYEIVCNINGDIYIGSSCQTYLSQRLALHVRSFRRWKKGKDSYCSSYSIIERNDYKIILIENYPCANSEELRARENYWITQKNCVNKRRALLTRETINEERRRRYKADEEFRQKCIEQSAQHVEENRDDINEKRRQRYNEDEEYRNRILEQQKNKTDEQKKKAVERAAKWNRENRERRNERDRLKRMSDLSS